MFFHGLLRGSWVVILALFVASSLYSSIPQTTFPLTSEPIDVVIPCAPKDRQSLGLCIQGIRQNGNNVRRIIVISKEKLTDAAEWFSEDAFPFSKEEIALEIFRGDAIAARNFIEQPDTRIGWVFQQFLKLYAPFIIPDISANVLILDADVIFLRSTSFMTEEGSPYFTPSDEICHVPYFNHAARLLPDLHRVYPEHSGIAHHMLFQKPILEDLFENIQTVHQIEPWKAICRAADLQDITFCGMSEYEIYFNFTLLRCSQAIIRPLRWTLIPSLRYLPAYRQGGFNFVCCPTWFSKLHSASSP